MSGLDGNLSGHGKLRRLADVPRKSNLSWIERSDLRRATNLSLVADLQHVLYVRRVFDLSRNDHLRWVSDLRNWSDVRQ